LPLRHSSFFAVVLGGTLGTVCNFNKTLARIRAAVEHHVFDTLAQCGLQIVVHADHARVDDAHVHSRLDGVVEEHGVDGFAHRVIAPEAETHVGHTARHLGAWQVLLDPARGLDEVHRVVVVLFDAGGNGEDVGVEDDVLGREIDLVDQNAVGALADLDLACVGVGLAFFVKGHHHRGRAVALDQPGLAFELFHALLHADRVDHRLALDALQTSLDDRPLGRIDHDRDARDIGLGGDQLQKTHHGRLAVEHGLVHVDVDDLRAVFDLLARHGQGLFVLAIEDHAREGLGAGHVGALTHVDEQRTFTNGDRLQAGQLHGGNGQGNRHGTHLRGHR